MNVQQYIADKYRNYLEETIGNGYDAKNPVDFMTDFDHAFDISGELWFYKPIDKMFEDHYYKLFGDSYHKKIERATEIVATIQLNLVDLGHLYDIASDYADERNGERR